MKLNRASQMSESIELGGILALGGGFMDAYSYTCRDKVFANAQTGNLLLLGIHLTQGNGRMVIRYLMPVLMFAAGIVIADLVRTVFGQMSLFHWRQLSVFCEIVALTVVAFIPRSMNLLANSIISLACGIQVESFRKIHGNLIATTMCIGNLRAAMNHLVTFCRCPEKKESLELYRSLLYFGIIFCFVLGAVIGNLFVNRYGDTAILFDSGILTAGLILMFADREKQMADTEENGLLDT